MKFHWCENWNDYRALVIPFLEREPAKYNLHLGLIEARAELPTNVAAFWVEDNGKCSLVGEINPFNLILSEANDAALMQLIVDRIYAERIPFSGLVAMKETSELFLKTWKDLTGVSPRHRTPQFIYECRPENLISVSSPDEFLEVASLADEDLLLQWMTEFVKEAVPHEIEKLPLMLEGMKKQIALGRYHLWLKGTTIVSFAGLTGRTRLSARIGPVYTPPEFRGRQHASRLTSALTEKIFALGHPTAVLYTDAENPTSNRIYQRLGYQEIGQSLHLIY